MADWTILIDGWNEAQLANQRLVAAVKPTGYLGRGVKAMTLEAQRQAINVTHVDTSALKHSHRVQFKNTKSDAVGVVYVGAVTNPKTGETTSNYGIIEHQRGGEHAFYQIVVTDRLDDLLRVFDRTFEGAFAR